MRYFRSCAIILLSLLLVDNCFAGVGFEGDVDKIQNTSLNLSNTNITIAFWVYLASSSLQGCFINTGDPSADPATEGIGIGVGTNTFENTGDTGNDLILLYNNIRWIDTNDALGTGWVHITVTLDGSGYPEAFINGTSSYSDSTGASGDPSARIDIGGYAYGAYDRHPACEITEIAIWNTVLTQTQIDLLVDSRLKNIPLQVAPANLQAYWALDEHPVGTGINGVTFNDFSGNGNSGTGTDTDADSFVTGETVLSYPAQILGN